MNILEKYKVIDDDTLSNLRKYYLDKYNFDLDSLVIDKFRYKKMKISFSGISKIEYKSIFYDYFKVYESFLDISTSFDQINKYLLNNYNFDLIELSYDENITIMDMIRNSNFDPNNNTNAKGENLPIAKIYGIDFPSYDSLHNELDKIKQYEDKFFQIFHIDLAKCYEACYINYLKEKNTKENKLSPFINISSTQNDTLFECFWKSLIHYKINNITVNNCKLMISSNTITKQDIGPNPSSDYINTNKDNVIAKKISDQLNELTSSWNDNTFISVLLDLYWNLRIIQNKNNTIQVKIIPEDSSSISVSAYKNASYKVLYNNQYKVKESIEKLKEKISTQNFLPIDINDCIYSTRPQKIKMSNTYPELLSNCLLNSTLKGFLSHNFGQSEKHKTFKDALNIFTTNFSFNTIEDFYSLECLMGFNLSMKLYEYIWPLYKSIKSKLPHLFLDDEIFFNKYLNPIITSLFCIKSPYLRLHICDIVIKPYSISTEIPSHQYLLALKAMHKFIDSYSTNINNMYSIAYDSMFYLYGNHLPFNKDDTNILQEFENLINNKYSHYIKIDRYNILSNVPTNTLNHDNPNYIWYELLNNERGNARDLYNDIMKGILLNNTTKVEKD